MKRSVVTGKRQEQVQGQVTGAGINLPPLSGPAHCYECDPIIRVRSQWELLRQDEALMIGGANNLCA